MAHLAIFGIMLLQNPLAARYEEETQRLTFPNSLESGLIVRSFPERPIEIQGIQEYRLVGRHHEKSCGVMFWVN